MGVGAALPFGHRRADAIVRVGSVADVVSAVRWAADQHVPIVVRGGGHSAWGSVPGGLTLDLAALDDVEVDGTLVRVGGGATWGHVAEVLSGHGLGVSSGDTASVGVGGLTLGGGIGWMVRAWGLAADQLVGAQLVTASGDVVEVTDASHPELLWALRGGGGNFGVVTRFDFRAHPLSSVVFATLGVSGDSRPILRALRDTLRDAPRELTVTFMDVPAMDPSAPAGATITAVLDRRRRGCRARCARAAARAATASRRPSIEVTRVSRDPARDARRRSRRSRCPASSAATRCCGTSATTRSTDSSSFREANAASVLFLRSLGGAFADVPQEGSAFPARDATWFAMAGAFDIPGLIDDESRPAILAAWDAIEALGSGVYGNFSTSTDAVFAAKMFPRGDDGSARGGQARVGPDERLLPQPQRAAGLRAVLRSAARGCGDPSVRVFGFDLGAVARPQGVEGAGLVDALVGVRAEEVALALHEGGGEALGAEAVVVRQRRRERGGGDAGARGDRTIRRQDALRAPEGLDEVRRGEQHRQVGGLAVGVGDAVEELGADDAAAAPDLRDRAEVDVPVVLGGAGADLVEALRVRDDLRRVQGEADVLDERVGVLDRERLDRAGQVRPRRRAARGGDDSERAKTASAMPETGTPRFRAVCTVHAPVPFAPAWSRMTSTSGLPVSAST